VKDRGRATDRANPPDDAYAAISGTFVGALAAGAAASAALGREPREQGVLDLVTLVAANFKVARTLAQDEVASFLREPFVERHAHAGGEEPVRGGLRQAVGELVTCTRCVGTWTAAALAATQVLWPRFGRLLT
jgi:hypothetical protein